MTGWHRRRISGLTTPDDSYHGITYAERFGKGAYITKATAQLMRDFGSIQSPQNAFYINLGLETLHLRMKRHCENALVVAKFLEGHEKVAWVNYPGLKINKYYELSKKYSQMVPAEYWHLELKVAGKDRFSSWINWNWHL